MRILLLNPTTTEAFTEDILTTAKKYARPDTEIEAFTAPFGPSTIEGHYEEEYAILGFLTQIREKAADYDGVILACYGDPGLYACREASPVPVVGIAEASMLMASTVAHSFSVVTVLPRIKPMIEDVVRRYGFQQRCASVRTTPLSVMDCERDPQRAVREIVKAAKAAVEEDQAEAILLGCGGMGPLDELVAAELAVPVIDGLVCAVKLLEGVNDYGLKTSRLAAFQEPDRSKAFIDLPVGAVS